MTLIILAIKNREISKKPNTKSKLEISHSIPQSGMPVSQIPLFNEYLLK